MFISRISYLIFSDGGWPQITENPDKGGLCGSCVCTKLLQLRLTLCKAMSYCLPSSSVHLILQAWIWEWVARPSSMASSRPQGSNQHLLCLLHWQASALPLAATKQKNWKKKKGVFLTRAKEGFPVGSEGKESACSAGGTTDLGSIPGFGRSPREVNGYPLQYSCLENSMDRGAWFMRSPRVGHKWATEHAWMHPWCLQFILKWPHQNNEYVYA